MYTKEADTTFTISFQLLVAWGKKE